MFLSQQCWFEYKNEYSFSSSEFEVPQNVDSIQWRSDQWTKEYTQYLKYAIPLSHNLCSG